MRNKPPSPRSISFTASRKSGLMKVLRKDGGWTFVEASFSIVLLTVVFLGFTITLLAFREWMDRSWAIRVMDQYANDLISDLEKKLRLASNIWQNPPQYGLGSFALSVYNLNFNDPYNVLQDSTVYAYSAKPSDGVFIGTGNTAPQKFDADFPPANWNKKHKFTFTEFYYPGPWIEPGRQPYFTNSMVQIFFTIHYERPRTVETPGGSQSRKYELDKRYSVSGFMKNHVNTP